MKTYELTCLIPSIISEIELELFQEKIMALLQKEQGVLLDETQQKPFKKKLTCHVKKANQAYLISFNFQINPEKLEAIKKELKTEPDLIRYALLVKKITKAPKRLKRTIKITKKISQPKVELKEIEKKLEEILGE